MQLTGAQALIKSLEMEGIEVMFGLPGGAILPVYDPLIDSSIRHVLVRHEQGAGHMAEGYAHATGRPGVAMVTSGPAATNIVTPLCDAYMDSIPIVVVTGQVPYSVIGTDAFQECDTVGITMPVTKHNWLITDAAEVPRVIREAFHVATTGRPGPVLVDMPKDVSNQMMSWYWPDGVDLPGYKPNTKGHAKQIKDAARLMGESTRPVIYAGGGILKARRAEALRDARRRHRDPGRHHVDGARCLPRRPPALSRHARHARQLHRGHVDAAGRPAHRARVAVRRSRHRQGVDVRARREDHPRRHRPRRARQGPPSRRPDRRRLPPGDRGARESGEGRPEQARLAVARRVAAAASARGRSSTRCATSSSTTGR